MWTIFKVFTKFVTISLLFMCWFLWLQGMWDLSLQTMDWTHTMGYMVHGILQARILERITFSFSRGIFPTQGLKPGLPHCRQILYQLSHRRSLRILEWVAYPFFTGASPPRNWTGVSCIAGGFFTNWAIRELEDNCLQCCVDFCYTSWISHIYIYILYIYITYIYLPSFLSLPTHSPNPILLGHHRAAGLAPCVQSPIILFRFSTFLIPLSHSISSFRKKQMKKNGENKACNRWKTWVRSLGQEDTLKKEMATHSSTLAWKIPWMEEPGRLQSMGLRKAGHDWATSLSQIFKYNYSVTSNSGESWKISIQQIFTSILSGFFFLLLP